MTDSKTTALVLLYGDYPQLAERCLKPLGQFRKAGIPVLIGANLPSSGTVKAVEKLGHTITYSAQPQIFKYPMMRKLLADVKTEYVMWFDDDSYISDPDPLTWLKITELRMISEDADLMGSLYFIQLRPEQQQWITTRPWYRGKPVPTKQKFVQGAWWMAKTATLRELNWPDPQIRHNGGDVMLGVAMEQNDKRMIPYRLHVAINADASGNESKSKRRGHSEQPIGVV